MALASFFPYLQFGLSRLNIYQTTHKVKQLYLRVIMLVVLIGTAFQAFSQSISSVKIKVLKHELEILSGRTDRLADSIRVENLNQIALYQSTTSLDSALITLKEAEFISIKGGLADLTAVTAYNRGQVYEQHGDFAKSEQAYLQWYNIRKMQDIRKYRWAMTGMREFYSRHMQFDKLELIDNEWVQLLDGQLAAGEEPLYTYEASMLAVVDNLVDLGEFYKAESYFLHLLENDPASVNWLQGSMFYFRIEDKLLDIGDVETLRDWYKRWFTAIIKYNNDGTEATKTMLIVSGHVKYDPRLVAYLLEDMFQLCVGIQDENANKSFLDYWIPKLNRVVEDNARNEVKSPIADRLLQHCITCNARAALLYTLTTEKNIQKEYLTSIKNATKAMESTDGIDLVFFNDFLNKLVNDNNGAVSKTLKKTLKKFKGLVG